MVILVELCMLDTLKHFEAFSKLTVYKYLRTETWKVALSESSICITGIIT